MNSGTKGTNMRRCLNTRGVFFAPVRRMPDANKHQLNAFRGLVELLCSQDKLQNLSETNAIFTLYFVSE